MRHARVRAQLGPYLEGELSPAAHRRVARHLERCSGCRAELEALRRTVQLLQRLPAEEPPPGLAERALARVAAEPEGWLGRWLARHGALVSAAVPVAAGVAIALAVLPRVEVTVRLGPGLGAPSPRLAERAAPVLQAPASEPGREAGRSAPPTPRAERIAASRTASVGASAPPAAGSDPGSAPAASSSPSPLPPRQACLGEAEGAAPDCARWHAWMVGLAMRDPAAFFAEIESLSADQQDRWLRDLSSFAAHAGAASLLANELRASGDPRAARVAPRFERITITGASAPR